MAPGTIERGDTRGAALAACCALTYALLMSAGALPAAAQEAPSAEALLERLRQIEGELRPGARPPEAPSSAEELIGRIRVIEEDLRTATDAAMSPALSEDEVRTLVQDSLGVEVLRAELLERDGQPVYALTVMNPPGNYNSAFMVRTILIDGMTGGIVGEVPQVPRTAASDLATSAVTSGPDGNGLEIRRRTYR